MKLFSERPRKAALREGHACIKDLTRSTLHGSVDSVGQQKGVVKLVATAGHVGLAGKVWPPAMASHGPPRSTMVASHGRLWQAMAGHGLGWPAMASLAKRLWSSWLAMNGHGRPGCLGHGRPWARKQAPKIGKRKYETGSELADSKPEI